MSKKLINIGIKAKKASKVKVDKKNKNKVLKKFLQLINKNKKKILRENNKDIEFAIKNNLPENLSSLNDVSKNYDKTVNEFIIYLIKTNKINEDKVKFIFNEYFSKKINNKIKKNYTNLILKLLDQLLPILLNQKQFQFLHWK